MIVREKVLKNETDFCYCCGKSLDKKEYLVNLGSTGAQFELCRSCLKKLHTKITKVLGAEYQG